MAREAIKFFEDLISETKRVLADRPEKLREVETVLPYYRMAIEALQERPKGRWIEKDGNAYCSECNACWGLDIHFDLADHKASHKFCNDCGADMRDNEEQDV